MRATYFDLDGTLLRMTTSIEAAMAEAFERVAGESPDSWLAAYNEGFLDRFRNCEPAPYRGGVEHLRAETDYDHGVEETAGALLDAELRATERTEDARAALNAAADRGRVGVLTNGVPEWQRAKLAACGLLGDVDAFVTAYEAGHHKPHRAPFDLAERRLPADEHALVGDSDADVDGAANAGWLAARYDGESLADAVDRV
ncbi:HAD family hydrolase [Halobacterium jilantaiense]|uniref:Putative hydrolase of the HAD superfamily n=1 Tax=Halobacterium jilantaiense TaxID=355548 RepID=A0A1I0QAI3_9EURY|nr:HAD family hydrolase [Halobacterium jilantaiense]SEW23829.1 putative hydrolase of the HAD superfamily [Halobacterium jilantaiense]